MALRTGSRCRVFLQLLQQEGWDLYLGDGAPSVWTHYDDGKVSNRVYCPYGNEVGVEPLIIHRSFSGIREDYTEVAQEFRLYYNLYPEPSKNHLLQIDQNGDESEAVRYGTDFVEIRTDLVLRFCATKQMALAIYIDSFRCSPHTLEELDIAEQRMPVSGDTYKYRLAFVPDDVSIEKNDFKSTGVLLGKKYVLPDPIPDKDADERKEVYQKFLTETDVRGQPVRHTSDPGPARGLFRQESRCTSLSHAGIFQG